MNSDSSRKKEEEEERVDKEISGGAKRLLVGAGARILFYPTLLYNVVRNKIQPLHFRWWDEVTQYLLLGAVPFPKDVLRLKQLGVSGVITLNEPFETLVSPSLYQEHGIDHLILPTRDYTYAPSFVDINRAADFIHNNASSGRKTYVHCKAGRGRSTTIAICYLVKYEHTTPGTALELIRSKRARVLLTSSQMKAVQAYHQYCLGATGHSTSVDAILATKPKLQGQNDTKCANGHSSELELTPAALDIKGNDDTSRNGRKKKRPCCFNALWTLASGCIPSSGTP